MLREWLNNLQNITDKYGNALAGTTEFVGFRRNRLSEINGTPAVSILRATPEDENDAFAAIALILQQVDPSDVVKALSGASVDELLKYREQIGVTALDQLIDEWEAMSQTATEAEWQTLLVRYVFALSQVFYAPTIIIKDEAYVGGKKVDNRGGSMVDFLLQNEITERAHLIEIKTPETNLLRKTPYRNEVEMGSPCLIGAVAQVMHYRDRFIDEVPEDHDEMPVALRRSLPMCGVIIGDRNQLTDRAKKRSFENFRSRGDVVILTFDEVLERLKAVRNVMRGAEVPE